MKNLIFILIIFQAILLSCVEGKQPADNVITVDVTKNNFPKKELIIQDFMNVEYIPLETTDEFINQGFVQEIGKEIILVINRTDDGNIYVYDRTGKALRKINRKGQGGEEYTYITKIILDEDNNEILVHDHHIKKIYVYDLYGNFKRSFSYKENTKGWLYTDMSNYNKTNLICFDEYNDKGRAFVLISKLDGSITKKIDISAKVLKLLMKLQFDEANNRVNGMAPDPYNTILPFNGGMILLDVFSDTIYTFMPNKTLRPFIVRTPSVKSMDPEVVLILRLLSDRYYFMETVKNEFNFESNTGFSKTYLMYDNQERSLFRYTVYNGDFTIKKEMYMSLLRPANDENESWQRLDAPQLVEAFQVGALKGRLKEIASALNEESNPVIMLIKPKK
ncbi:MAG: 6-bladed beta-propeller [Macellibacteroides fermentans]|uniref:6-bladed beta-propeller n=1 Tax=Macellibacteroides fermentans TaxID=879969 RepID=UPI003AC43CC3